MNRTNDQNARIMEALKKLRLSDSEEEEEQTHPNSSEQNSEKKDANTNSFHSNSSVCESNNAILQSKYSKQKLSNESNPGKENVNILNTRKMQTFQAAQKLDRPVTSSSKYLPLQKKAPWNANDKSFIKINVRNNSEMERPKTSNPGKENVRFQPVYTEAYNHFLITNKCFNYKDKKFITVAKKTDIVAKFQNFKKGWEKTKFLKNNSLAGKQGRKLNLAERINNDRPEEMFYRYVPKAGLY